MDPWWYLSEQRHYFLFVAKFKLYKKLKFEVMWCVANEPKVGVDGDHLILKKLLWNKTFWHIFLYIFLLTTKNRNIIILKKCLEMIVRTEGVGGDRSRQTSYFLLPLFAESYAVSVRQSLSELWFNLYAVLCQNLKGPAMEISSLIKFERTLYMSYIINNNNILCICCICIVSKKYASQKRP